MIGGWRVVAASVIGTAHDRTGVSCQDSHDCRLVPLVSGGQVFVGVAADGAGSAECSGLGSRICCQTVATAVARHLSEGHHPATVNRAQVLEWVEEARAEIQMA